MRHWGPQQRGKPSVWWPVIGRNKKGVTLDLRQAEGQSLFKDLVRKSDVVIENFRPGTLEKWDCGWEELAALNPRLILVRVSGYGQTGPYAQRAGYGGIGEAMGGLRYIVGEPDRPPSRVGHQHRRLAGGRACLHGHAGRPAPPRAHRRGPGGRRRDLRVRAQHDGVAGHRVRSAGSRARTQRPDPAAHRAVQCVSDARWHRDDRRQPGHGVRAAVRGHGQRRSSPAIRAIADHQARGANQRELDE